MAIASQEPLSWSGDLRDSVVCPEEPPEGRLLEVRVRFTGP
jgi:hypothetical protein